MQRSNNTHETVTKMLFENVKKVFHTTLIVLTLALFLFLVPSFALSATLTWTGSGGSSAFGNAGNWSPAQTPTLADDCIINSTSSNQPVISTNSSCGSLTLGTGGTVMTLSFATTRNLTIAGDVTIGPNGRITNSGGSASGSFQIGGNWSDDLATANIDTAASLLITYLFTGTNKSITTNNETFFNVEINGDISLNGDMTAGNRFRIVNGASFTQGPDTLTLNGNFFDISNGTYNHDCGSTMVINGRITMSNNDHYPNTIVNSTGRLDGPNTGFIDCDLTIQAGGELLTATNFFIGGDWINNGGTITHGTDAVYMTGAGAQIAGTTPTTFYNLIIGDGAGDSTTAVRDITIDNNFTVTAGTDFTLQAGTDITLTSGSATINGTVSLSGTSTWYQASSGGIEVNPGGLISAQGTDSANRVTFTRSDASYYDFFINGGIDFDNVNIFYTRSANTNAGFVIRGPGVVSFNTVAFDLTQDVNAAVMMRWESPQSITAQGCSFNSGTYTQGNGDVNVEAVQGQIVFVNYGGNYGGEALDNDNGGEAIWDPAVTSAVSEIDPNAVVALSTGNAFTYDVLPTMQPWDTGVDQIVITAPAGYSNLNVTGVSVGGANRTANCPAPGVNEYCPTIAGQTITVLLGSTVTTSLTNIQILFNADAPAIVGENYFTSTVDDTSTSTPPQATTPGNADGDAGDANSQTVNVTAAGLLNWIGGVSTDFGDPNNWGPNLAPDASRKCIIDSYTTFQPVLLSNETCGELVLGTGATLITLTFTGTNDLTITGDVDIGTNGRIAESGTGNATFFNIGGSWSDDPATTNFIGTIPISYFFTGTGETISTNENFYFVTINGMISLASDISIGNSLIILNGKTLNHGAFTISHYGNNFTVNGIYNHTCSSVVELSGTISMASNKHYPNVVVNSGGSLIGTNPAYIDCDLTTQSGSTFSYGTALFIGGDWINNGATLDPQSSTVTMTGTGAEIRGTASVPFNTLVIGDGAGDSTTALVDISMETNFNVPAGVTFTLQGGRNISVSGITTIGGEVYISGNSTWLHSGINNGIEVYSGGLLSAQGTDAANRVTFDWLAGVNYDLVINGGIDFNYVNVFNADSARFNDQGFRINTPAGETLQFNHVAINDTLDVVNSVMLFWNSPQTITCNRCSFDSPTYSPANDVNVEALQGEIIFLGYGGNFAGEALDDDNGGTATWIPIATTIGDGTAPADKTVQPNATNQAVDAFTLSTNLGTDTLTDLTVTFSGTDVNDVAASGVKIYEDNGGTPNEWDAGDTLIDTSTFVGTTASFTGLSIAADTTSVQYLITYDIAAAPGPSNTLQGTVSAATVTTNYPAIINDTTDATLTIAPVCSVTTTTDGVAGSLRSCIQWANGNPGVDIINVPAGTYTLTVAGSGEDAAATGDLDITESLTITGAGAATTMIDAAGLTPADRVFHVIAGDILMSDLTIRNGDAGGNEGGGIYAQSGGTSLSLTNVIVTGNRGNQGGGIRTSIPTTLTDCEISGNTASFFGGGIRSDISLTLNRVALSGNDATNGGGLANIAPAGIVDLTNVTISGNTASSSGGGFYNEKGATLTNVTVYGNTAPSGGGIWRTGGSTTTFSNTIVANNTGGNCSHTSMVTNGGNLEATTDTCGFDDPSDQVNVTLAQLNIGPLQDNGGPTATHELLAGSFAIDTALSGNCPATDQRTVARGFDGDGAPNSPQPGDCDIGAFEYNGGSLLIVKQAWLENGTAPLASPVNLPKGMTVVFLIYVKNIASSAALDVRINDDLDTAGFQYIPGSLVRDDSSLADTATDLEIFNATAPGTGIPLSDAQDADIASSCDVSEVLCPGSEADRSTIGAVAAQPNAVVNINGNATFAIRFRVTVK